MAFNIVDREGRHLGVIVETYEKLEGVYLVALTPQKAKEVIGVNFDRLRKVMANRKDASSIFGGVNEYLLEEAVEERAQELSLPEDWSFEKKMQYLFLRSSTHLMKEFFKVGIYEDQIKGFILLEIKAAEVVSEGLVIDDRLDYLQEPALMDGLPLLGKTVGYPVISTDVMGDVEGLLLGGSLSDLGGRNHVHRTDLNVLSGNCTKELSLPFNMPLKDNTPLQLYYEKNHIRKIFVDGVIYRL